MEVRLQEATENDLELILAWRSHPKMYRFFRNQNSPLNWEEHLNFWKTRENRKDWIILFKGKDDERWRRIGSLNISELNKDFPEIGLFIGEISLWGRGLGEQALRKGLNWLRENKYSGALAVVFKNNVRSQKLFEKVGFYKASLLKDRYWQYKYKFT